MIRRIANYSLKNLNANEDLKDFWNWKNIEKYIIEKEGYAQVLKCFYPNEVLRFIGKIEKAAQNGRPNAQFILGDLLEYGVRDENRQEIIKSDPLKAIEWLEKAAQAGLSSAQYKLGCTLKFVLFAKEDHIQENPQKAMEWFEAAARNGCERSQFELGEILRDGVRDKNGQEIIKKNPLKAMEWFEKAAQYGHRNAQYNLGEMLRDGVRDENGQEIIKKNPLKAIECLEKAAQDGDENAQLELGEMLRDGVRDENGREIIKRNTLKAMEWFETVSRNDGYHIDAAQVELVKISYNGARDENGVEIIKKDPIKAIKSLEEFAEDGNDFAQFELGKMLWDGVRDENGLEIIKKDPIKAIKLFKDAGRAGNKKAEFEFGKMLLSGVKDESGKEIIKKNPLKAQLWLEANCGNWRNPDAQFELAKILWNGVKDESGQEIIKKNHQEALKYLKEAAQQGHETATAALQQLRQQQQKARPVAPAPVQQNTFDVRSTWKFNPAELRDATEAEKQFYDKVIQKVEESSLTNVEKYRAKNALLRFKTLHANNVAICRELMETPEVRTYSENVYAVTPRDILIHPEQGDASLEQRAHIIYNILETTYAGVKGDPVSLEKFFKEAFTDTIPCLEAQSVKIDEWRASQESIEIKISRQSIAKNIGDHANQLLEDMRKNSKVGKKLIIAQQDHQRFSEKLQKVPNVPVEHPQYHQLKETKEFFEVALKHISKSIKTFEKKHEKWLKNNNKYAEMHQNLLTTLVGKIAQDGEITENAINDMLSLLGWDIPTQE